MAAKTPNPWTLTFKERFHLSKRFNRYSAPGSQLVVDEWKMDFNTFMSSALSYVVLEVDASGSGGQGQDKVTQVKNKLGQVEVQDQLDAAK